MRAPRFTRPEREQIAARYQDGETMPQLAEAYGCSGSVIHRALKKQRVQTRTLSEARKAGRNVNELNPCRECGTGCSPQAVKPLCPVCARLYCQRCDQKLPAGWKAQECQTCKFNRRYRYRPPRLCRICGRMGARATKRDLCAVHVKLYCRVCEEHMPPGRVLPRCTGCENAKKQRLWEKPGRLCAFCGTREVKIHASRCQHCLHEDYEIWRWALLYIDRPCRQCGVTLARGRRLNYCPACEFKRERRRRAERQVLGAHNCALCAEPLSLSRQTYCGGCDTLLNNWRKAWHAGNKIARQLGTVRTQRRWQEKAA